MIKMEENQTDKKTIVIVDDESMILNLYVSYLSRFGCYNIIPYGNPIDALDYITNNHNSIDLLVSDMTMKGMNGKTLISKIKGMNANIGTILISGSNEEELFLDNEYDIDVFIKKPLPNNKYLKDTIDTLLDKYR